MAETTRSRATRTAGEQTRRFLASLALVLFGGASLLVSPPARAQTLFGVDFDSGDLYRISAGDASLVRVAGTGLPQLAGLEDSIDGLLYGLSTGDAPVLYRIDPATGAPAPVGPLGIGFVFEGALAIAPDGTAYGASQNNAANSMLFRVDLATGAGTIVGRIGAGFHDVNGLAWRRDGMLVGADRWNDELIAIDPATGASSVIARVPESLGGVGGMACAGGGAAFLATAGPAPPIGIPGSNPLYFVDLFTGGVSLVGRFDPAVVAGSGISGLAAAPVSCAAGTVGAASGPATDVLFVNGTSGGASRTVLLAPGEPVHLALVTAPAGPSESRYVAWTWK